MGDPTSSPLLFFCLPFLKIHDLTMGIFVVGFLFLTWWLATGLHHQDSAIDVLHILLSAFRAVDLDTGSSASFAIPVFMKLEGWRLLYSNLIRDYWYPLLSLIPWCGHRCALPISWSHKWELCICGRPVFISTSISKMCGLTGLQRCYSSQYTPYTIHVSINVDRHVNFVRPSIRSHSVLFVCFFAHSCSRYTSQGR